MATLSRRVSDKAGAKTLRVSSYAGNIYFIISYARDMKTHY